MVSDNTIRILNYLKEHKGEDLTAADVAEALDINKRSVDGAFTLALQKKGYGVRVEAEVELENGLHKTVKLLRLTDEGYAYDPTATNEIVVG